MEFIASGEIRTLSNPGVASRQLLNPDNSSSQRITLTEVHLSADASQPPHTHDASEQIWYALRGRGTLLLAGDLRKPFCAGDVVRFGEGEVHGLLNDSEHEFVYLSVTSPPIHFGYAYQKQE